LTARECAAGGSFSDPTPPENALASAASPPRLAMGEATGRVVRSAEPPEPAAREIENAAAKAAMASTNPVATSLTATTA